MTDDTNRLRVLAPAAAEWPSWWRRNLTPGAVYIIGAVVLSAAVTVTTFIVSGHRDASDMTELKQQVKETNTRLGVIERDVSAIKQYEHDMDEAEKTRNPYVKHHGVLR